jgi:hypothetical protein
MSHSTNVGFSGPPTLALRGKLFRNSCEGPPLLDASCVVGVGRIIALTPSTKDPELPFRRNLSPLSGDRNAATPGPLVGVGHIPRRAIPISVSRSAAFGDADLFDV